MASSKSSTTWSASAVLVVLLAGCAPATTRDDVATRPAEGAGHAALLEGILTTDDGCVVLTDDFGETWVPVFPDDLTWDKTGTRLHDEVLVLGERVGLGGGEAPARQDAWSIPEACPQGAPLWAVAG